MSRKHPALLSGAALVAAAALLPISPARGTGQETLTLELRHREAKVNFVDVPPRRTRRHPSESPGDLAVGTALLRDAAGRIVGRSHQSFMVTGGRGEATLEQVTATFVLGHDKITLQGVADNRRSAGPTVMAITGGTGRFEGARGSVHLAESREAVKFELRYER